jgi:hypothetical protein
MHLYNYIWVVLLVHRLNLTFLSPKLSCGIDKVLVYLCPCGFDNPRNTLRWKLLQLGSVRLRIILLGLRTTHNRRLCTTGHRAMLLHHPSRHRRPWLDLGYPFEFIKIRPSVMDSVVEIRTSRTLSFHKISAVDHEFNDPHLMKLMNPWRAIVDPFLETANLFHEFSFRKIFLNFGKS